MNKKNNDKNKNNKNKMMSVTVIPTQANTDRLHPYTQQEPPQPRPPQPNTETQGRQSYPQLEPTPKPAQWNEMSTRAKVRWRQAQKHL